MVAGYFDVEAERNFSSIYVHLETDQQCLTLQEFIRLANSTGTISKDIATYLFQNDASISLLVYPPEEGSFKLKLALAIAITSSAIGTGWSFLNSDIASAFIDGLTGHDSKYWAMEVGKDIRRAIATTPKFIHSEEKHFLESTAGKIIAECTSSFLLSDEHTLEKIGVHPSKFRQAYLSRNLFYETCIENVSIQGVGFSAKDDFPIRRNKFPEKILPVPDPDPKDDHPEWIFETKDIVIVSPVWERDGRKWQASFELSGRKFTTPISIEDDLFWNYVDTKKLKPKIFDNMRVQWAYLLEGGRQKNTRVLRVLNFNTRRISRKLSKKDLKDILINCTEALHDQPDLFNN